MELKKRLSESQKKQMETEQKRLASMSDEDLREEIFNDAPTPPHEPTLAEQEQMRRLRERRSHGG